ncbi:hypothetical protein Tco_1245842 [Tanacetum coccineum]
MLIKFILQIKHEASDKDKLVIMLLNMLEVVKKDIFDERDSSMMDPSRKYFAKLNFPVTKETDAWKEKIRRLHLLLTEKESAMDLNRLIFVLHPLKVKLNKIAPRMICVLHPLKVVITNLKPSSIIDLDVKQWPAAPKYDASSCYKVLLRRFSVSSKRKEVQKEVLLCSNASNQVLLRETIGFDSLISILKLRGTTYSFTQQKAKEEYKYASSTNIMFKSYWEHSDVLKKIDCIINDMAKDERVKRGSEYMILEQDKDE